MRSIYDIQKDISKAKWMLDQLILEKRLTMQVLEGLEASSYILAKQAIEKMTNAR
jgi:hypothetical protein